MYIQKMYIKDTYVHMRMKKNKANNDNNKNENNKNKNKNNNGTCPVGYASKEQLRRQIALVECL